MFVIRPIARQDGEKFQQLAFHDYIGMTALPFTSNGIEWGITRSIASFSHLHAAPKDEFYLFVLEREETKELCGFSAIFSKSGVNFPDYYYRLEEEVNPCQLKEAVEPLELLKPVSESRGPTKIGALYIAPHFRDLRLGPLLSRSRFLFMAAFPQLFEQKVIAEMRGIINPDGSSPFWDGLGRHFLNLELPDVLTLQESGKAFIASILPKYPIYRSLLCKPTQEAIGRTHEHTRAAFHMLVNEGFSPTNDIDVFDGGPKMAAATASIRSVSHSLVLRVEAIKSVLPQSPLMLISNERLSFRCCMDHVQVINDTAILSEEVAKALQVSAGDSIRCVPKELNQPLIKNGNPSV